MVSSLFGLAWHAIHSPSAACLLAAWLAEKIYLPAWLAWHAYICYGDQGRMEYPHDHFQKGSIGSPPMNLPSKSSISPPAVVAVGEGKGAIFTSVTVSGATFFFDLDFFSR